MKDWTARTDIGVLQGRRVLDTAEGILIGLRRYQPDAAFAELLDVSRRHTVPVFALATALIQLAGGTARPTGSALSAWSSAEYEWGRHLADSRGA